MVVRQNAWSYFNFLIPLQTSEVWICGQFLYWILWSYKNRIYSFMFGENVLWMFIMSIWFIISVNSKNSLFIVESELLNSSTTSVWESLHDLSYKNASFINIGVLVFGAQVLRITTSFKGFFLWWICSVFPYLFW